LSTHTVHNDNNNTNANVYGAIIMAEPLRQFTRFIWWMYKKLSCRRETARRFVLLTILLSHSVSLKVIRN